MTILYVMIAASVILGAVGQLMMKVGVLAIADYFEQSSSVLEADILQAAIPVIVGIGCYFGAVLAWIFVLRSCSLNVVSPYLCLTYVFVFVGCAFLPNLNENITLLSAVGLITILIGLHISVGQSVTASGRADRE